MDYSSDKIVLNFYTNQQYVIDQCKPQLAKKWIPEWWKKLPASRTESNLHTEGSPVPVSSMKQCMKKHPRNSNDAKTIPNA